AHRLVARSFAETSSAREWRHWFARTRQGPRRATPRSKTSNTMSLQLLYLRQQLNRRVAKLKIDALRANDALAVHDHDSHFGKLSHHPHGPVGTQLHIVLLYYIERGVR